MAIFEVYGLGGFDPSKPNNNVIESYETEDEPEVDTTALADALAALPQEQLDALKLALGL